MSAEACKLIDERIADLLFVRRADNPFVDDVAREQIDYAMHELADLRSKLSPAPALRSAIDAARFTESRGVVRCKGCGKRRGQGHFAGCAVPGVDLPTIPNFGKAPKPGSAAWDKLAASVIRRLEDWQHDSACGVRKVGAWAR